MPVAFQVSDKSALLFDALLTRSNVPFQARAELLVLREISSFSDQQSEQSLAFGRVKRCLQLLLKLRNVSLEGGRSFASVNAGISVWSTCATVETFGPCFRDRFRLNSITTIVFSQHNRCLMATFWQRCRFFGEFRLARLPHQRGLEGTQ